MTDHTRPFSGLDGASSPPVMDTDRVDVLTAAAFQAIPNPSVPRFRMSLQIKGWAVKALEFINSGPPALLNNPCCSRRVVVSPFIKHAMEVHYG